MKTSTVLVLGALALLALAAAGAQWGESTGVAAEQAAEGAPAEAQAGAAGDAARRAPPRATPAPAAGETPREEAPERFIARGRLVSLPLEMKERFGAQVPPVHDRILGLRLSGDLSPGELRYYTLLRTPLSEALYVDERFQERDLLLTGRLFPGSAVFEVHRFQWYRAGRLTDAYYWCEVCSIRGVDPGPCACCQAPVELREAEVGRRSPASSADPAAKKR